MLISYGSFHSAALAPETLWRYSHQIDGLQAGKLPHREDPAPPMSHFRDAHAVTNVLIQNTKDAFFSFCWRLTSTETSYGLVGNGGMGDGGKGGGRVVGTTRATGITMVANQPVQCNSCALLFQRSLGMNGSESESESEQSHKDSVHKKTSAENN